MFGLLGESPRCSVASQISIHGWFAILANTGTSEAELEWAAIPTVYERFLLLGFCEFANLQGCATLITWISVRATTGIPAPRAKFSENAL